MNPAPPPDPGLSVLGGLSCREGGGWEGAFEGLRSPRGSERRGNPCPCLLRNVIVRYPDGQILETILMSGRVCEVSFAFSDISFQLSPLPSGYLQQLEIHTVQSIEESKRRLVAGPICGLFGPTTLFCHFRIFWYFHWTVDTGCQGTLQ